MLDKIKISTVVCALFFIVTLFYFYFAMGLKYWSAQYAPGPGFITRWTSGIMLVLSAIAFFNSLKEEGPTLSKILPKERSNRINLYVCIGGLIFFLLFATKLGFIVTSTIILTAMISRGTSWTKAVLISITLTIICFFIFRYLMKVQIPVNQFGW